MVVLLPLAVVPLERSTTPGGSGTVLAVLHISSVVVYTTVVCTDSHTHDSRAAVDCVHSTLGDSTAPYGAVVPLLLQR